MKHIFFYRYYLIMHASKINRFWYFKNISIKRN